MLTKRAGDYLSDVMELLTLSALASAWTPVMSVSKPVRCAFTGPRVRLLLATLKGSAYVRVSPD